FTIDVVDMYTMDSTTHISRTEDSRSVAEALAQHGYLATSPTNPSLAISFKTLELFRRLRLRKPSFSVEAFTKVVCDFYAIPYRRTHRVALSNAFDTYLAIHRIIDRRINSTLGRDTPDWRVLNACLACCYELEDEAPLRFSRMICVDGNNSLKRMAKVADRQVGDSRVFSESDYFLPEDYVNTYAHEVKARKRTQESAEVPSPSVEADTVDDQEGDPTDLATHSPDEKSCTQNWKAAADDLKKRMWGVFEETGIFASACRHGFILWIMDMIRSGELAKYPLAIVSKVLQLFGPAGLLGYDIGCDFEQTVKQSSLGPLWEKLRWRCCVNAFHGYSHNFRCQTRYHPNNILGMGLEDLETLERIFSASNQLAAIIRYASRFRRHVAIAMFYKQWDEDKYANLALMLYNNYVQACEIIRTESQVVAEALESLGISEADLEKWYVEEAEYFATLGEEQPWDVHAMAYVELLQESRHLDATTQFLTTTPSDYQFVFPNSTPSRRTYDGDISRTRRLESERRHLQERREHVHRDLIETEVHMGIQTRWQPTTPEYIATLKYVSMRQYHRALDNLQRLVIQRLFELHNLNLSQTGYRMRTHIAKSLQTRCQAIRNAVNTYNRAALALDPPRPTLDWDKVSHFSFLEEFNLLRDTRNDIRDKPWTRPAVREIMKKNRRIARAREELQRCNVEVRRLHTSIEDENKHFRTTLAALREENSPLYGAVADYAARRMHVNGHLLARIHLIYRLDGFTGNTMKGRRKGTASAEDTLDSVGDMPPTEIARDEHLLEDDGIDEDEMQDHIAGIIQYISDLPANT
ncbi:hypothetical protein CERSUDRAFT_55723, partial [Gelatoporia subvermispora B]